MRTQYKVHDDNYAYFMTSTIVEWIPVFTTKKYMDIIIDSLKFCQQEKEMKIYAFVILDNHFHLIAQAPQLSQLMQSFKRFTANTIIDQLQRDRKEWLLHLFEYYKLKHKKNSDHQVWQEGFQPKQLPTHEILLQKMTYVHYNPVERGLVKKPEDWVYSSAGYYESGDESLLTMDELMPF